METTRDWYKRGWVNEIPGVHFFRKDKTYTLHMYQYIYRWLPPLVGVLTSGIFNFLGKSNTHCVICVTESKWTRRCLVLGMNSSCMHSRPISQQEFAPCQTSSIPQQIVYNTTAQCNGYAPRHNGWRSPLRSLDTCVGGISPNCPQKHS